MVNKLTNQEIVKVFAMYWGQEYHVCYNIEGVRVNGLINERTIGDICPDAENKRDLLALRLLPDITDEDANTLGLINGNITDNPKLVGRSLAYCLNENIKNRYIAFEAFQFLVNQGYAVPLHFGVGHWANGKNAIELGIAVDEKTLGTPAKKDVYVCVNCKRFWIGIKERCFKCDGQTMEITHPSNAAYAENKELHE